MVVQNVRVSVGRTWRFVTEGGLACAETDLRGFRERLGALKGTNVPAPFGLPWPPPPQRNRFWAHMFGDDYRNAELRTLQHALLPLRWSGEHPGGVTGRVQVATEAFWHPFAVTTLAHLTLGPERPWTSSDEAAGRLRQVISSSLVGGNQVRDGLPLTSLPALPSVEFEGEQARYMHYGKFRLISAMHDEPDPAGMASSLALLFEGGPRPAAAQPLKSDRSHICLDEQNIGFVLPSKNFPRGDQKLACLHRNFTTLLSYLQNLATLTRIDPTPSCEPFQTAAATMLRRFYERQLPIYRSRLATLWIDQEQLAQHINALTSDLPALPEP